MFDRDFGKAHPQHRDGARHTAKCVRDHHGILARIGGLRIRARKITERRSGEVRAVEKPLIIQRRQSARHNPEGCGLAGGYRLALRLGKDRRGLVRLHMGHRVAEADPAARGAEREAAEPAAREVNPGRAVGFEVDPADVGSVGVPTQVAGTVHVDAKIVGGKILVLQPIGRLAVAQADPAEVRSEDVAGTNLGANAQVRSLFYSIAPVGRTSPKAFALPGTRSARAAADGSIAGTATLTRIEREGRLQRL